MSRQLVTIPHLVADAGARYGDAAFLTNGTTSLSFAEAASRIARAAGSLRERGVVRGDRVALVAGNSVATVIAWLGVMHAGAMPAALNPMLTPPEMAYAIEDLQPRLVLREAELPALGEGAEATPIPDGSPSDAAAIVYTSGTTSRPKGVLVRHLAYVGAGQSIPTWLGLGADERLWCILPFFHLNAQAYSLMTALAAGYRLEISDRFHASTFWKDAAALDVTEVNLIGAMLAILARQPADAFVPGNLRTLYAAPTLGPAADRAFEARFGVRIVTGMGMTENTFGCIQSPTSVHKGVSIGRPRVHPDGLIGNEMRIVTPEGEIAGIGVAGELQFRNAAVTPGYWNAPEITASALADGWLHTGDAGYIDSDGDVILVARYKEMIRRRGENIAPGEVEDVLALHPDVVEAAVIGVPSDLSEEDVVACVVRREGAKAGEGELTSWCRERLAPYKVPMRILFREELPHTPTMRIAKDRLKKEILAETSSLHGESN